MYDWIIIRCEDHSVEFDALALFLGNGEDGRPEYDLREAADEAALAEGTFNHRFCDLSS